MSPLVMSDSTFGTVVRLSELDVSDGFEINGIERGWKTVLAFSVYLVQGG